jgi:hypothetical protein
MNLFEQFEGLSECISRAIQEHLAKSNISWPHELTRPVLRVEAFLEDEYHRQGNVSPHSSQIASVRMKPMNPAPGSKVWLNMPLWTLHRRIECALLWPPIATRPSGV